MFLSICFNILHDEFNILIYQVFVTSSLPQCSDGKSLFYLIAVITYFIAATIKNFCAN